MVRKSTSCAYIKNSSTRCWDDRKAKILLMVLHRLDHGNIILIRLKAELKANLESKRINLKKGWAENDNG